MRRIVAVVLALVLTYQTGTVIGNALTETSERMVGQVFPTQEGK